MPRVELSVEINRPIEEVFAFVDDHENDARWSSGVNEFVQTSDGLWGLGATGQTMQRRAGREVVTYYEVIGHEPPGRFTMKMWVGQTSGQLTFIFETVDGGTSVTLLLNMVVRGLFKMTGPILAFMLRRENKEALRRLKEVLEAESWST